MFSQQNGSGHGLSVEHYYQHMCVEDIPHCRRNLGPRNRSLGVRPTINNVRSTPLLYPTISLRSITTVFGPYPDKRLVEIKSKDEPQKTTALYCRRPVFLNCTADFRSFVFRLLTPSSRRWSSYPELGNICPPSGSGEKVSSATHTFWNRKRFLHVTFFLFNPVNNNQYKDYLNK